jgi:[ribosomal protein S5]-alanine N-acetyltransferase
MSAMTDVALLDEDGMLDLTAAFAAFPILETPRLTLRAVEPGDAEALFRIMSDPQVMRYFGRPPMLTPPEAIEQVQALAVAFREHSGIRWGITWRDTGQFIGSCGFWRIVKPHFRAEIGYELASECWGRGVMTEAVSAALNFGFTQMRLHSVEAQIHPDNVGSRRVLEKLGFVQEGYFRENYYEPQVQQFTDTAVFSMLRSTWINRADP